METPSMHLPPLKRLAALAGAVCITGSVCVYVCEVRAQISAPNGNEPQESRAAPMGTRNDPPPAQTLESTRSQTSERRTGQGKKPGNESQQPRQKPEGAGGFENGLYGTGTGSNNK